MINIGIDTFRFTTNTCIMIKTIAKEGSLKQEFTES